MGKSKKVDSGNETIKLKKWARETAASAPDSVPTAVTATARKASLAEHDQADSYRESEFLDGCETRVTSDGAIMHEGHRTDFEHLTSIDDERPLKRSARTDQDIAAELRDAGIELGERCQRHNIPGCGPCRSLDQSLQRQAANPDRHTVAITKISPPNQSPVPKIELLDESDVRRLRADWTEPSRASAVDLAADQKELERNKVVQLKVTPHLRREYGYKPRDLAALLDRPGFNTTELRIDYAPLETDSKLRRWNLELQYGRRKRSPKTLPELDNYLPLKEVPLFSPEQIRWYKNYASGNSTPQTQKDRDTLLELENAIIVRAWSTHCLPLKKCRPEDDFDRVLESDWDAETKSGTFGDTVVKAGYKSTPGKTFQPKAMNTFERGPIHAAHDKASGDETGGEGLHDDYTEDSGA